MPITNKISSILKPKILAPALFAGLGGYKTYKDYKKAKPENKYYTFVKDAMVLTTSAAGYLAATTLIKHTPNLPIVDKTVHFLGKGLKKIADIKFVKEKITPHFKKHLKPLEQTPKFMHKSLNHIEQAIKDCIAATVITLGSIISALGGNVLVSKYIFKKHTEEKHNKSVKDNKDKVTSKIPQNIEGKKNNNEPVNTIVKTDQSKSLNYLQFVNQEFAKDPANKVFASVSFLPVLRALEFPMTAVQGFDISHEKNMTDKIKKTSYSLIANTFVPTFFISIATAITRGMKNVVRFPVICVTTLLGIAAGAAAGKYTENKVLEDLHLR